MFIYRGPCVVALPIVLMLKLATALAVAHYHTVSVPMTEREVLDIILIYFHVE